MQYPFVYIYISTYPPFGTIWNLSMLMCHHSTLYYIYLTLNISGKRVTVEEGALERLRARLHQVLQKARVEEVQLPIKKNQGGGDMSEDDDEVVVVSLSLLIPPHTTLM